MVNSRLAGHPVPEGPAKRFSTLPGPWQEPRQPGSSPPADRLRQGVGAQRASGGCCSASCNGVIVMGAETRGLGPCTCMSTGNTDIGPTRLLALHASSPLGYESVTFMPSCPPASSACVLGAIAMLGPRASLHGRPPLPPPPTTPTVSTPPAAPGAGEPGAVQRVPHPARPRRPGRGGAGGRRPFRPSGPRQLLYAAREGLRSARGRVRTLRPSTSPSSRCSCPGPWPCSSRWAPPTRVVEAAAAAPASLAKGPRGRSQPRGRAGVGPRRGAGHGPGALRPRAARAEAGGGAERVWRAGAAPPRPRPARPARPARSGRRAGRAARRGRARPAAGAGAGARDRSALRAAAGAGGRRCATSARGHPARRSSAAAAALGNCWRPAQPAARFPCRARAGRAGWGPRRRPAALGALSADELAGVADWERVAGDRGAFPSPPTAHRGGPGLHRHGVHPAAAAPGGHRRRRRGQHPVGEFRWWAPGAPGRWAAGGEGSARCCLPQPPGPQAGGRDPCLAQAPRGLAPSNTPHSLCLGIRAAARHDHPPGGLPRAPGRPRGGAGDPGGGRANWGHPGVRVQEGGVGLGWDQRLPLGGSGDTGLHFVASGRALTATTNLPPPSRPLSAAALETPGPDDAFPSCDGVMTGSGRRRRATSLPGLCAFVEKVGRVSLRMRTVVLGCSPTMQTSSDRHGSLPLSGWHRIRAPPSPEHTAPSSNTPSGWS